MGDTGRGAEYEAGLDGLRAVAVVAVVLFHSEFEWARGGFLGVSIFFTLSGFLITRLLLVERERNGRIGLRRFWSRRLRRLAPASLLCLGIVAICIPWFAASARIATVRGDILAAVGYSANWRFVAAEQSYADLFVGGPSPVLHFWSLAIEEQFYVVFPVVIAAACWLAARLRRPAVVAVVLVVLTALSVGAGMLTDDHDLFYYGTHTRAAEFLIGSLAAVAWLRSQRLQQVLRARRLRPLVACGSLVALVAAGQLATSTRQSAPWLYAGGFALLALLWVALIFAAMTPGPLRAVLSTRPIVAVGKLSFGIYLFHWPLFQLITPQRLQSNDWRLHAVRYGATLVLAAISYALVEQPIRTRRIALPSWSGGAALVSAVASVVVLALLLAPSTTTPAAASMVDAPDEVVSFGADSANAQVAVGTVGQSAGDDSTLTSDAARRPVVMITGSERGVVAAAADAPFDIVDLTSECSFLRRSPADGTSGELCLDPAATVAGYLRDGGDVDAVVISFGDLDHVAVAERLATGMQFGVPGVAAEHAAVARELDRIGSLHAMRANAPTYLIDVATTAPDPLTQLLREAATTHPNVSVTTADTVAAAITAALPRDSAPTVKRARMMVIGDSTSFGIAEQIDALAGDRYDVVWAGRRNCPWVPATTVRWWEGAEFEMSSCLEGQATWPQVAADLEPDVLLIVASLPELSDHRYANDDAWHAIGDLEFERQHRAALRRLTDMVAPYGAITLIADTPTSEWTNDERVAEFNLGLARWARDVPATSVLSYGRFVELAERVAGKSLRPDNVHLDAAALRPIVDERLLPQIDAALARAATSGSPGS